MSARVRGSRLLALASLFLCFGVVASCRRKKRARRETAFDGVTVICRGEALVWRVIHVDFISVWSAAFLRRSRGSLGIFWLVWSSFLARVLWSRSYLSLLVLWYGSFLPPREESERRETARTYSLTCYLSSWRCRPRPPREERLLLMESPSFAAARRLFGG